MHTVVWWYGVICQLRQFSMSPKGFFVFMGGSGYFRLRGPHHNAPTHFPIFFAWVQSGWFLRKAYSCSWLIWLPSLLGSYPCVCNTSNTVLGDMPLLETCLYYKTCHTIVPKTRLEYRTHQFSIDVTMTSLLLRSNKGRFMTGWNCRHGKLFTQRPGWNKRILGKIQCVLNKSPVTCIQDKRVTSQNLPLP